MIGEAFKSFKDNIKIKTTNPFFGTLIIVWIYENWKLLVTFYNLDSKLTLNEKISLLNQFLNSTSFSLNMLKCILMTILVLIVTYGLLNLSRLIVTFYEKKVTPYIYKITDKNSIVLKSEYDALINQIEKVEEKYIKERNERIKYQQELSTLEKELYESKISKNDNADFEIVSEKQSTINKVDDFAVKIYKKIKDRDLISLFEKTLNDTLTYSWIENSKNLKYFITLGLFEIEDGSGDSQNVKLKLTEKGETFREFYVDNYL